MGGLCLKGNRISLLSELSLQGEGLLHRELASETPPSGYPPHCILPPFIRAYGHQRILVLYGEAPVKEFFPANWRKSTALNHDVRYPSQKALNSYR